MNSVWLSWHNSQRSKSLAKKLNVPKFEYVNEANFVIRHLFSSLWTLFILFKKRPLIIYIQYSFMLLLIVYFYKKLNKKNVLVIVDCHTKALLRNVNTIFSKLFVFVKRKSFKAANICIVSNCELVQEIEKFNDNYFVLPDPIPELDNITNIHEQLNEYCVYSNSYATDEPFEEFIKAAEKLEGKIKVICTGKIPKKLSYLKVQPHRNVHFTDYVSDKEYNSLIADAQCMLALTNDESTLLCSGYEALSLNTPLIISDTRVLRKYFADAVIYTKNTSDDIAQNILLCLKEKSSIKRKMQIHKEQKIGQYDLQLLKLKKKIQACHIN